MTAPRPSGLQILTQTVTVEFDQRAYFRVEIFLVETGAAMAAATYFAEVYMLRLPYGQIAKAEPRVDTRFRQSWFFLDDFPLICGSSPDEVRQLVFDQLQKYTASYLSEFEAGVKRQRPPL